MSKKIKGISGIVIGLIAAIIFITVVLPLTVSYIVNTTNRFGTKSYMIEHQKYKLIEEKGISACYTQLPNGTYVIELNNTLGKPVVIELLYAKYSSGTETITQINSKITSSTTIPLDGTLEPKVVKIITSSGAVINIPPCNSILATVTATVTKEIAYTDIITYIITNRYPVNVYWDESQYPEGISPKEVTVAIPFTIPFILTTTVTVTTMNLGYILSYTDGKIYTISTDNYQTTLLINGTLTPRKEWFDEEIRYLLELFGGNITHAPSFVLNTGPGSMSLVSVDSGDYLAMVLTVNSTAYDPSNDNGTDTYGFWPIEGYWFEYGSYLENKPFKVIKLILNTSYKFSAGNSTQPDPLKYILVNSGYDYVIVGLQTSDFDPLEDYGINKFTYQGTIYVNPKSPAQDLNSSRIIISFKVTETRNNPSDDLTINFDYVKLRLPNGTWIDWTAAYREFIRYESSLLPLGINYWSVLMDQIVFNIPENLLGVSGGDDVYVWAEASFIVNSGGSPIIVSDNSTSWVSYTYMPVKPIVDSWIGK